MKVKVDLAVVDIFKTFFDIAAFVSISVYFLPWCLCFIEICVNFWSTSLPQNRRGSRNFSRGWGLNFKKKN